MRLFGFFTAAILLLNSSTSYATNRYWQVSSGDWSTPANWGGLEPTSGDWAYINNSGTAIITQTGEACTRLFLGYYSTDKGTVQINSGDFTILDVGWIGLYGTGTITQSGGTNSISDSLLLGCYSGSSGSYNLSGDGHLSADLEDVGLGGDATFTHTDGINSVGYQLNLGLDAGAIGNYYLGGTGQVSVQHECVGAYGTGKFTQTGGMNSITDTLTLGNQSGSIGNYSLSGTGQLTAKKETIGAFGVGTFSQTGGTNTITDTLSLGSYSGLTGFYNLSGNGQVSAANENLGNWSNGTGTFTQSGGTNTVTNILSIGSASNSIGSYTLFGTGQLSAFSEIIGDYGNGTFTQYGGTNTITNGLFLGYYSGSSGTYNLNGGTLILKLMLKASGTALFNFGGGTLQASGAFSTSLPLTLTGVGGDANIDTAGYNVTCSGILSGTGGLTKIGSGTLTLSATNTFTGSVNFKGGLIKTAALSRLGNGTALNFSGGGLQFDAVFDPSARVMTFLAGGATLDTQTYNITLARQIGNGGIGSLTKLGSGKLTLNALNTYTGNTIIHGGALEIAGGIAAGGTSLIDVQSGKAVLKTVNVSKADLDISTVAGGTFEILNGIHEVGDITGGGITLIDAGASLTAASIQQGTLTIGSGAKVTIKPLSAGTLNGALTPVPEPSAMVLIGLTFILMSLKRQTQTLR
jgi:autotransporter-associated beta strand protein